MLYRIIQGERSLGKTSQLNLGRSMSLLDAYYGIRSCRQVQITANGIYPKLVAR
jgi:hypothetical protein